MKPPIGQAWIDRGVIRERPPDPQDAEPCPMCGTVDCSAPVHTVERIWTEEDFDVEAEANRPVVVAEEFWEDVNVENIRTRQLKFHKGQVITRREAERHKGLAWTEQDQPQVRGGIETK